MIDQLNVYVVLLLGTAMLLTACADAQGIRDTSNWETNWSERSIDLSELQAGGPPKDGIPSIDHPQFISTEDARSWLAPQEPVIALVHDGEARAYPLQILTFHEIVNDRIGDTPVAVTFCPLCYSAIAYERTVDGRVLAFGVSGLLRHSDLVMYDRQTETLWQQLSGKAIVGDMTGTTLEMLPAQIISFEQFTNAHPDGKVLSRDTGHNRNYGRNPYAGYDDIDKKPFLYRGPYDDRLPPMEKVVTLSLDGVDKAYPHSTTREQRVIHDEVAGQPVVIFHGQGAVSALDRSQISRSKEIGSTGVFSPVVDGRALHFRYEAGAFIDDETGSTWDITGHAIAGELEGTQLDPIPHGNYFSFAWFAFKPNTDVYQAD